MNHFIKQLTIGTVLGLAVMVGGAFATPAHAVLIDFSSGSPIAPLTSNGPTGYTEAHMTVISEYVGSGAPHIHLVSGGNPGTALYNHSGCCSSPFVFYFDVPVNIISIDWRFGGSNSFLTNAPDATVAFLPYVSDWTTFTVASMATFPLDFLDITQITWTQSGRYLYLDNLIYEVAAAPVPEPSTMLLFGSGLAGLVAWRFRKHQA